MFAAMFHVSRISSSLLTRNLPGYLPRGRLLSTTFTAPTPKRKGAALLDNFPRNITFNNYQSGKIAISTTAFFENAWKLKTKPIKRKGDCSGKSAKKDDCDGKAGGKKHGHISHGQLWFIEKAVSAMLVPVVPLAIFYPNVLFDLILIFTLAPHIHWGIVATVIDYVRPIIVGEYFAKVAEWCCYGISIFIIIGLLNLAIRGQGIGNSFQTLWSM